MRRGILEAAPARAATDRPGPARCLRGAVGEPERRLRSPPCPCTGVRRTCRDSRPLARLPGSSARSGWCARAGWRARRDRLAAQARRPGCVFGAYARAALSGRSRRAAIRSHAAHGRRCLRWQRSLRAALVPYQRRSRSRAGEEHEQTTLVNSVSEGILVKRGGLF